MDRMSVATRRRMAVTTKIAGGYQLIVPENTAAKRIGAMNWPLRASRTLQAPISRPLGQSFGASMSASEVAQGDAGDPRYPHTVAPMKIHDRPFRSAPRTRLPTRSMTMQVNKMTWSIRIECDLVMTSTAASLTGNVAGSGTSGRPEVDGSSGTPGASRGVRSVGST